MGSPAGEDQSVKLYGSAIVHHKAPAFRADFLDFAHQHINVVLILQKVPKRQGHVSCRKFGCGHFIQERLKDMMILTINQRDADAIAIEFAGGCQAPETASDDNDVMQLLVHNSSYGCEVGSW